MLLAEGLNSHRGLGLLILLVAGVLFVVRTAVATFILWGTCRIRESQGDLPVSLKRVLSISAASTVIGGMLMIGAMKQFHKLEQTWLISILIVEGVVMIPIIQRWLPASSRSSLILSATLHFGLLFLYGGAYSLIQFLDTGSR